jgi:pilus assembly protein CpaF
MMSDVDMPLAAMRTQIGSGVQIVVQVARLQDGSRKVTHITEVLGFDIAKQAYLLQDLYVRRYSGMTRDNRIRSRLVPTGVLPACKAQLEEHGMTLPVEMLRCAASAAALKGIEDAAQ